MNRSKANLVNFLYLGGYGITLLANPNMFYGPDGILPYFTQNFEGNGLWMARAFGACLVGLASGSFIEPDSKVVSKMNLIAGACMWPLFPMAIADPKNFIHYMWK